MHASPPGTRPDRHLHWLLAVAAVYLALRLAGMLTTQPLYNQDSINYLEWAATFRAWDWVGIVGMDPDAAPLYSLLTGLFSWLTGDMILAARLVSLAASVAAAAAVYVLTRRLVNPAAAVLAVLLLAVNPHFIRFSYAEMTEMLYIAIFAWIVVLVVADIRRPKPVNGAILGLLCGLAFLTKVEAVLLLPAIPILYWFHTLLWNRSAPKAPVFLSNLLLVTIMVAISAPQVLRVSNLMGSFALNGRVAWTKILTVPDGRSYNEKLSGLDYDPKTTNLIYLQRHPEELDALVGSHGTSEWLKGYLETGVRNLKEMHDFELARLIGLPVLVFGTIGFIALLRAGGAEDLTPLLALILITLVAPVTYMVTERHLLILLPFAALFAGAGIRDTAATLSGSPVLERLRRGWMVAAVVIVALSVSLLEMSFRYVRPDLYRGEYVIDTLDQPMAIVRARAEELGRPVTVMSRKSFLPYLAGAKRDVPPYTDLDGLLIYLEGRGVDFLFIEERHIDDYPFFAEIGGDKWNAHFEQVHALRHRGTTEALYKVL